MIVLSGADIVQPAGIHSGTLVIEGERIVEVRPGAMDAAGARGAVDLRDHIVLPGFIDVHVHGVEGADTLGGGDAVAAIAACLPKFGVTAFCPTTVACSPDALRDVLRQVRALRHGSPAPASARVLPAHLESNFINPEYRGAQAAGCLRLPPSKNQTNRRDHVFDGHDILAEIESGADNVGIVTLAPELDGALDLIRRLVSNGCRVSLGHSGATLAEARAAIDAGARHATHLFNRMPPLGHREPGLAGAILTSAAVAAEIICDGVHVHRDMVRMAIDAKGTARVMAITDSVAAAGMADGSVASLGGRAIHVKNSAAYLEDGTLAGSVATMDRVFRFLVSDVGLPLKEAAQLCATTQASELGLRDTGSVVQGALADIVVMDRTFTVKQTYIRGHLAYSAM